MWQKPLKIQTQECVERGWFASTAIVVAKSLIQLPFDPTGIFSPRYAT